MKALFAILLSAVTFLAVAQPGYVTDGSGQIVKTGSGLCLHSGSYTPADAVKGCDPVAEKPQPKAVTLNADVLFEFDSAVITAKGQQALTQFAKTIRPNATVTIVGHTDRIGTKEYNQRLSVARAESVAKFLGNRTTAYYQTSGVGMSQPSGETKLCTGLEKRSFEKYKACLAPDRRVVITVK